VRRASRVAIISDFLGEEEETLRAARELAVAGTELHAVHMVAPGELEPGAAVALVVDPEAETVVRPLSPETRAEYLRAFGAWREQLAEAWRAAGAFYSIVRSDESAWRAARRVVSATGGAGR
jgi:uncharacterized protein (DUF58 family)